MCIDHGGTDISMAKQLLDAPNVYSRVQQVSRERMPQGMRSHFLGNGRSVNCSCNRPTDGLLVLMMTTPNLGAWISR
jgi:hypothetical protein